MLLKVDAAQLEWRVKAFLAQDKLAIQEIHEVEAGAIGIHDRNKEAFGLPTKLIAKTFVYRMIFADAFGEKGFSGPAYSYANDAEFQGTSKSVKYWEEVVGRFFDKYKGIHAHSVDSIRQAVDTGRLVVPSGRFYDFSPRVQWHGGIDWPRTNILNYPVQGFSADLVQVARLLLKQKLLEFGHYDQVLLINTVHDDIELDVDNDPYLLYNIILLLEEAFKEIPQGFKQMYGSGINVPMAGEVKFGTNLDEDQMHKFNKTTFFEDYKRFYGD